MTPRDKLLTWTLDSTFEAIEPVCKRLKGLLKAYGKTGLVFAADVLLREALTNAIEHGNRFDPQKKVACRLRIDKQRLEIEVEDDGPGFNWQKFIDRPIGASTKKRGRGHDIYRLYAQQTLYNDSGNRIQLRLDLSLPKKTC
jgi:serine/threonine-protein kinase RsbW